MTAKHESFRAIEWCEGALQLLDQRWLPDRVVYRRCTSAGEVAEAIRSMVVRGAPAIGLSAAYGVVLSARQHCGWGDGGHGGSAASAGEQAWREGVSADMALIGAARPTAVNLSWALERMRLRLQEGLADPMAALLSEARAMHDEDVAANRRMGKHGAELIEEPCAVLTHCNAGALATGGFGTALGVVRAGYADGRITRVFAAETRPWLQGARLTAWELAQDGIPVSLVADGAAAWLMKQGSVRWVIVGADRIAANGDTANKIGTYALALAARQLGIQFMVVAPVSTVDPGSPDGAAIPIETRDQREVLECVGHRVAPDVPLVGAWNPAFDVTPHGLISAIVTERGVIRDPHRDSMAVLLPEGLGSDRRT